MKFSLKSLFGTGYFRPQIGDRVMHKASRECGTVLGKATIKGSVTVYAITVKYDDGHTALQVSENEFIKIDKKDRRNAR